MARSDGKIIITTEVDNSKLSKQLDALEKKLENQKIDLNVTTIDYESAKRQLDNIDRDLQRNKQKEEEIKGQIQEQIKLRERLKAQGKDTSGVTQYITSLYQQLDPVSAETIRLLDSWNKQYDVVDKIEQKMGKQNRDIEETEGKINNVKLAMQQAGRIDMSKTMKNMSKNLEKVTKKISKMGLMLLGVRSIYGMISSAMNRLKEENPQLASVMQTISNAFDIIVGRLIAELMPTIRELLPTLIQIANVVLNIVVAVIRFLLPVIKFIVNVLSIIVNFIGNLLSDLFGIDIATNNFAKGLDKANKKASAIRKQLMGFDEMNILNKDTGGTGAVSGLSGIGDQLGGIEDSLPDWVRHPMNLIVKIGEAIVEGAKAIGKFYITAWDKIKNLFNPLHWASVFKDWWDAFWDEIYPDKHNIEFYDLFSFGGYQEGSKDQVDKKTGKAIEKTITIMENGKKRVIKVQQDTAENSSAIVDDNLAKIITAFNGAEVKIVDGYYEIQSGAGMTMRLTKEEYNNMITRLQNGTLQYSDLVQKNVGNMEKKSLGAYSTIEDKATTTHHNIQAKTEETGQVAEDTSVKTENIFTRTWNLIKDIANGNIDEISTHFETMPESAKTNTEKAGTEIRNETNKYNQNPAKANIETKQDPKKNSGTTINEIKGDVDQQNRNPFTIPLKVVADTLPFIKEITKLAKASPVLFAPIVASLQKLGYKVAKGGIIGVPHLASGGIVNRVGRGVPLASGGAIAGERGREAVIPLTDSQQMSYLGREIAKNVIINLTNVTELDGRVLARSVSKVMQNTQFASNGGVI